MFLHNNKRVVYYILMNLIFASFHNIVKLYYE